MKKFLSVILAMVMVFSLTACGSSSSDNSGSASSDPDASASGTSSGSAKYVMKLCFENNDGDPIDLGCDKWAELVSEQTNGEVEIQVYPSSQLGAKADLIEMMLMGQNVCTIADGSYLMDYVPDFGVVMGPYLFDDWDQMYKLTSSDWWQEEEGLLEEQNLKIISTNWIYGDRQLLTKKPITSLKDLKGLKIRVPNNDISVDMFNMLGCAATPLALSEVYTALSQGVVDGVENPLTTLYNNNFQEVCKYLTLTSHQMTFSNFIVGMKFWSTIPEEYQKIIMDCADEAAEYNNEKYQEQSEEMLDKFEEAGVQVTELEDSDEFKEAVLQLYEKYEENGTWTAGLYERIQEILND